MSKSYMLLWLEAPMQSWGHESRFGRRESLNFPTKSGVMGLICCARGAGGEQKEWLAKWLDLDMQVETFLLKGGGCGDTLSPQILRDFHMVGSGYNDKDEWERLLIPKRNDGGKSIGGGAKITYRQYLQDVAFAVVMEMPSHDVAADVEKSLKAPVWDLFLGRKSCAPTEIIFQGIFEDVNKALSAGRMLAETKGRILTQRVLQGEHEGGNVLIINDVPLQMGERKKYRDRYVTVQKLVGTGGFTKNPEK